MAELDGEAGLFFGRVAEVRGGKISTMTVAGEERAVRVGGRNWVWSERWKTAAIHLMMEKKAAYASYGAALWAVVNKRKKLEAEGVLPAWDAAKPAKKPVALSPCPSRDSGEACEKCGAEGEESCQI